MQRLQFRRLYREFLFRTIDIEVLAPQGNMSKLLGQFAALLLLFSFWVLLPAVLMTDGPPSEMTLLASLTTEHLLIATTMLVTGIFAVLSWETMFPDRRDVLVLAPLPIRTRVLFAAKIAAVISALGVTVVCLDVIPGLVAPFTLSSTPTIPDAAYSTALPPIPVERLQSVLDHDMEAQRESTTGQLALGRDAGVAVGVMQRGVRRVFTYGTAQPNSIFEIGSISKTFTGLLLARAAVEGQCKAARSGT